MKILVLSPGMPSAKNSGLGIATNAIHKELTTVAELIIVQPDNAAEHGIDGIETETSIFSNESIAQQEIRVTVAARLDAYYYQTSDTGNKAAKEDYKSVNEEIEKYTQQVLTKTKKANFDLIYAHDWVTYQTAVAIKEKTEIPFVAHVHSLDYDRGAKRYRSFVFDIEQTTLAKADAIIAVSNYTRDVLVKQYDINKEKITVVHNAVVPFKTPVVKKLLPEKIILFVGRLTIQKGLQIFMEIAEQLMARRDDVRFVMVGDGDLYNQLVERSAKALHSKFHFTGHCSKEEVHKFYAMADVYCMPSISEPFGLTAVEAASAGVPVLLSEHTGAKEILKGAFMADPARPKTFVDQLEFILDNPEQVKKSVTENINSLKGLSWENSTKQIVKIFNTCLKG